MISKTNTKKYLSKNDKDSHNYKNNKDSHKENIDSFKDDRNYGFEDNNFFSEKKQQWTKGRTIALVLAILLIIGVWLALDQKLLFGKSWISPTYDNVDWRNNEGNLHTFGAWDLETHVWKTEYIMKNFPNFLWNPYWYLGMPLIKYYQSGFYWMHWLTIVLTGQNPARAALLMLIFAHLIATFLTFLLCYKVSRKIWVSALCAIFLLSNTFISLRSYGWEPITVVFLFLYPLGLYLFFKEPLRPFRFSLILLLGISYLTHPLLWFSLCMTMFIYLISIAVRKDITKHAKESHYILQLFMVVLISLMIGAVQFIPQITYQQVTSGAHMGLKYLPYYQVPPNIISLVDFFFDAGNLKGPGPIIMISFFLLILFFIIQYMQKKVVWKKIHQHELITGITLTIFIMVLFYYLELYNIFPMNILSSIQYHRIIPEFIIISAVLVAALSNFAYTKMEKTIYYSMLIAFVAASGIIIYNIQSQWQTSDTISNKPEFITDNFTGRISMPYTDQSLAVRNSYTFIPQTYGYYEQGITNSYDDEMFSVSSGYQNANLTVLYLKAANVERLYVNLEEGERDQILMNRLNGTLSLIKPNKIRVNSQSSTQNITQNNTQNNTRYGYYDLNLTDPSYSQAIDYNKAMALQKLEPGCRVLFSQTYCGSVGEEFVATDPAETKYLEGYVNLLEEPYTASSIMTMKDPDHYDIAVSNATVSTAIVVKMTYDADFSARVDNKTVKIVPFGPDFILIIPQKPGNYHIELDYGINKLMLIGLAISILTIISLGIYFLVRRTYATFIVDFPEGDLA